MTPSPRRRIVGTSLKMYFDLPTTKAYAHSVTTLAELAAASNIDLFLIPDFISLTTCAQVLSPHPQILLGAQDTFYETKGPYTGEVSPLNLFQAGARIVEIGHAERRRLFGETDADVARKAQAAVSHNLIPLVCVGETSVPGPIASRAVGIAVSECKPQIAAVLAAIPPEAELLIAYEPVWAIGAEKPASADHVVAVTRELRRIVEETGRSGPCRILYGGSAGPGTFEGLKDGVDGLFLGRFGHDVGNLEKVIREMAA